jgi:hypothetical protein
MRTGRRQFSIRFLLLLLTMTACVAFQLRHRRVEVEFTVAGFTNEVEEPNKRPFIAAHVQLTNRSPNDLWYHALSSGHPDFETSQNRHSKWQWSQYTAEPKQWFLLRRGNSVSLVVPLYDDAEALRVAVTFYTRRRGKPATVWSDRFLVRRPRMITKLERSGSGWR